MPRKNPESSFVTRNKAIAAVAALAVAAGVGVGARELNSNNEHPKVQTSTPNQSIEQRYPDIIIEPVQVPLGPLQPRVENRDKP
jgi:hypothetical protein